MEIFKQAKDAKKCIQNLSQNVVSNIIRDYGNAITENISKILDRNKLDITAMDTNDPKIDRLLLTESRLHSIVYDILKIALLDFNPFKQITQYDTKKGLHITKQSCPLGVVGMIYESRPNVTIDAIVLCLKSQNVSILKGSKEAVNSNAILVNIVKDILSSYNLDINCINLMDSKRESVMEMINATGYVDICIPRGGKGLIEFVRDNAKIPVIETGAGVVHIYIDESADIKGASEIIFNAKTRRPAVCNSVDCVLIHKALLPHLDTILGKILKYNVEIIGDEMIANEIIRIQGTKIQIATENDYLTEFLSLKMCVKIVDNIDDAIKHIQNYSSNHTDVILSNNEGNITKFIKNIDSAVININTSSAFTDGGEFDMASEIGISTQKLHARGPFSLDALLSYKWIVNSDYLTR